AVVDRHSARARDVAAMPCGGDDVRAERIEPARRTVIGQVLDHLRKTEVRIPLKIAKLHDHLLNVIAVRTDESSPEGIEGLSELGCPGRGFNFIRAEAKASIHAIQKYRLPIRVRGGDNLRRR